MYLPIACPAGTHIPKTKQKKQFTAAVYYEKGHVQRKLILL